MEYGRHAENAEVAPSSVLVSLFPLDAGSMRSFGNASGWMKRAFGGGGSPAGLAGPGGLGGARKGAGGGRKDRFPGM